MDKQAAMEKIRDKLANVRQEMFKSQHGMREAYFDGKMNAFAEAIKIMEKASE